MSAKRFAFISFGCLCLMLSAMVGYHLGSTSAVAQPAAGDQYRALQAVNNLVIHHYVLRANGDFYVRRTDINDLRLVGELIYLGNFWDGPLPTSQSTWGDIKAKNK